MLYFIFSAESCTVTTISSNVHHNQNKGRTILKFEADNTNATYTCKLDRQSFQPCKFTYRDASYYFLIATIL